MARYTGPMTKKSRRLGIDLVGGDSAYERRPYPPGQHGRGRIKESEYLLQLREKQKARFTYGVLEKQFHNYYTEASRRQGKTGDNLLQLLECRPANVVSPPGFARPRRAARQLVVHGHFHVNGRKVDIPSYQVSQYDVIDVREKSLEMTPFIVARETHGERVVPAWLEAIPARMRILVHQLPVRGQIDIPVQEQLIVEYYSKKEALVPVPRHCIAPLTTESSSPSNSGWARKGKIQCSSHSVLLCRKRASTSSVRSSSSNRSSPASATRSATRCGVPCCRPSPVPRSRASRSTPSCMSSRR